MPGKITLQGAPSVNVESHPIPVGGLDSGRHGHLASWNSKRSTAAPRRSPSRPPIRLTAMWSWPRRSPSRSWPDLSTRPHRHHRDGRTSESPGRRLHTLDRHCHPDRLFLQPGLGQDDWAHALNGSSDITPVNAVTNQAGQATFTVTDSTAEVVTYQATDVTDGNAVLVAEGVVTFGNPPALPLVAAVCSVSVNPSTLPADGTNTATVSVLLYDGSGDPLAGKTVTLSGSGRRFDRHCDECDDQQQWSGYIRSERHNGGIGEVHGRRHIRQPEPDRAPVTVTFTFAMRRPRHEHDRDHVNLGHDDGDGINAGRARSSYSHARGRDSPGPRGTRGVDVGSSLAVDRLPPYSCRG